jgi:signal transduction histidine kinase
VRLQIDGDFATPLIEADGDQIRQALSALVANAAEAIGDKPAVVTISTSVCTIDATSDEWWRHTATPLDAGQYVVLSVEDEGCGVDPATVPRMFDPFFTTKFPGRGLGLAAVLGIVRAHRGGIAVHSQPGQGTRVEMALPVSTQGAPAAAVGS